MASSIDLARTLVSLFYFSTIQMLRSFALSLLAVSAIAADGSPISYAENGADWVDQGECNG